MSKVFRYVEIVGTMPQNPHNLVPKEKRQRRVLVGPLANVELFRNDFNEAITCKRAPRYSVKFALRDQTRCPKDVTPISAAEATSLNWLPQEWLAENKLTAKAEIIPTESFAAEPTLAGATA